MGNYTIFFWGGGFENPRRGRQARNLTTNVIFQKLSLGAPTKRLDTNDKKKKSPALELFLSSFLQNQMVYDDL